MKILLLMSGGIDSTLVAYSYAEWHLATAIGFDYGQKHVKELDYAQATCDRLGMPFVRMTLPSEAMPHTSTVVPNRNMVFASVSAAYAIAHGFEAISVGCNADDEELFPDCTTPFWFALGKLLRMGNEDPPRVLTPLIDRSKQSIMDELREYTSLDTTWSCYEGQDVPCFACPACTLRFSPKQASLI